jgi:FkbM family methyltransferase
MSVPEFIYTVLLKPAPLRKAANFVLKSILPRTVEVKGAIIHLNPEDPVVSGALALNVYEKAEIEFFYKWFEPCMNFVDVGANVGLYTGMALRKKNQNAFALSIEPDLQSVKFLKKTIASNNNKNIFLCPIAASENSDKIFLYKNSQNKGDNRIYPDSILDECDAINSDTIDNLCKIHCIKKIDFIKIDVQGAEFKALSGGSQILTESPDCILMTEFWPYGLNKCNSCPEDYLIFLQELGFSLFKLSGKNLIKIINLKKIINESSGRLYKNIIGLKGKYLLKI